MFNSLVKSTALLQTTADHAARLSNRDEVYEGWRHSYSEITSKSFYFSWEGAETQPTERETHKDTKMGIETWKRNGNGESEADQTKEWKIDWQKENFLSSIRRKEVHQNSEEILGRHTKRGKGTRLSFLPSLALPNMNNFFLICKDQMAENKKDIASVKLVTKHDNRKTDAATKKRQVSEDDKSKLMEGH